MKKTILLLAFIFGAAGAFFQKLPAQTPSFTNYLTYADTRSLAFQGTSVWAATFNGVLRRDANTGVLLDHFTKENSGLASNDVKFIAVDNAGTVWVTYGDHYLGKYSGGVWTNIDLNTYGTGLSGGQIFPDPAGGVWVAFGAYSNFGVLRVMGTSVNQYSSSNTGGALMSNGVVHIAFAASGKRLFTVAGYSPDGGLAVFDGVNWSKFTTGDIDIGFSKLKKTIIDPANNYWVLSDHFLSKFDGNDWTNYPLPGESYLYFTDVAIDLTGKLWATIEGDISSGAIYLQNGLWSPVFNHSNSLFYGSVFQVVVDASDNKWFLGWENMSFSQKKIVFRYDNIAWHVQNMGIGQTGQYPEVNVLAKDASDKVWAGMARDGMAKHLSGNTWSVFMENTIREKTFGTMAVDNANRLVNFFGGNPFYLTTFDGTNYNTILGPANEALFYTGRLLVDQNNHYWITSSQFLYEYTGSSWVKYSSTEIGVPNFELGQMAVDDQNVKWVAGNLVYPTPNLGLFRFDGTTWTQFTTANSGIPANGVIDVDVDHAGDKWVTTTNGIGRLQGNTWTTFNMANTPEFSTNNFTSIFVDKAHQNVWFYGTETLSAGSYTGILLMKYHNGEWQKYPISAFQSYYYFNITSNAIFDEEGNLWFGAREGASPCHPSPCYTGFVVRAAPGGAASKIGVGNLTMVTSLAIDQSGTIWSGGELYSIPNTFGTGLSKVSASGVTNAGYDDEIANVRILDMEADQSGNIWIGTIDGLTKMAFTPAATYCQSYSLFPWEDWIAKVRIGAIDNASGKSPYSDFTNLSAGLTAGAAVPIELTTGFSYFTWDEYWRVWIDLNHDGDFTDTGETVFEGIKNKPANGTPAATLAGNLNIPASALTGATRMRVSMKRNAYATPCEILPFGEVEDYTVNITGVTGCSPDVTPPVMNGCPADIALTSAVPATISWTPPTATDNCGVPTLTSTQQPGATFQFGTTTVTYTAKDAANNMALCSFNVTVTQVSPNLPDLTLSNLVAPASGVVGTIVNFSFTLNNIGAATAWGNYVIGAYLSTDNAWSPNDILAGTVPTGNTPVNFNTIVPASITIPMGTASGNYYLICVADKDKVLQELNENNNTVSAPFTVQPLSGNYCQSISNFPWEDWIAGVKIANLNNPSSKSPYSNFTNLSADVSAGQSYPLQLTTGYSYFTWDEYWKVWIDYNKNGVFEEPGELAFSGILGKPANGTATAVLNGNVNIPANAPTGTTRMRVSMKRGAYATPCETLPFGEVEDYTINIGGGGPACTILFVTSNVQCLDNGTPLDPIDDKFSFTILVSGNNTGTTWQMTWNGGSSAGNFGVAKTIGPLSQAAFQNSFNFTINDPAHPGCETNGSLTPPPPCSIPVSCGFNKEYVATDGYEGLDIQRTVNGFKIRGRKYDPALGYSHLILDTDYEGNKTGSVIHSNNFLPLRDGNFLQSSVTADNKVKLVKKTPAQVEIWSLTYEVPNSMFTSLGNVIELDGGNLWAVGVFGDGQTQPNKIFASWISASGNNHWTTLATPQVSNTYSIFTLKQSRDGGFFVTMTGGPAQNFFGKLSATGAPLWNVHIGGQYESNVNGVAEANDGSILVGIQSGTGGQCTDHETLKMFTASGTLVWEKTSIGPVPPGGSLCESYLEGITHTLDGGFAVKMKAFYTFGNTTSTVRSLVKINTAGDIVWTRNYGNLDGSVNFLSTAPDGGFLMTGQRNNLLWFMRTDAEGNVCETPPPPPGDYCDSQSDAPWHDWIARVKLNTLDNQSAKSVYSEFTGLSTTLQKGQGYPITLTTGFSWETFNEYWRVWIDYNQDGVFSTPDELVQQQVLTAPANGTPTASITSSVNVPQGALTGTTRMRVSMKRGAYASSCEHFTNGEVEDYTIVIVNSLTGGEGERTAGITFDAMAQTASVKLFGAYHQPEAVAEVVFEKSTDGENYLPLAVQPGEFTSAVKAIDNEPVEGFNYYRLLLHLTTGGVRVSPVRVVSFEPVPDFTVFPNPATNLVHLNLKTLLGKPALIRLLDARGIVVKTTVLDKVETAVLDLPLNVPSGYYFLWLETPGRRPVSKALVIDSGF